MQSAVVDLVDRMQQFSWTYEILLAENGSKDRTVELGKALEERFEQVSIHSIGEPNYGKALRKGIERARGELIICDEIDLCDTDFYRRAIGILETHGADFVVGSKVMAGASDERPLFRHASTLVLNGMLRVALGFRGTDTHGLKAFRRSAVIDTVDQCLVDKDLFASELVIRAERNDIRIKEIPIRLMEKRPPSIGLMRRVPNVLKNMAKLVVAIRVRG